MLLTNNSLTPLRACGFIFHDHWAESRAGKETRLHRPILVLKRRVKAEGNASLLSKAGKKKSSILFPFPSFTITDLGQDCEATAQAKSSPPLVYADRFTETQPGDSLWRLLHHTRVVLTSCSRAPGRRPTGKIVSLSVPAAARDNAQAPPPRK